MPIKSVKQTNANALEFEISEVDVSLVNALRRIILSEYPTVGFNTDDYLNSDLKISENTSFLHNEMLLHRISLIPIHADPEKWEPKKYEFSIQAENKTKIPLPVTSKDIVVVDTETQSKLDTNKFFPPNPISKDHILIVVLKPNPGDEGQKIDIKGIASVGIGQMHSRYSPVCKATYQFIQDKDRLKVALEQKLATAKDEEKDRVKLDFELGDAQRHFKINEKGQPNHYLFTLESIGVFPPQLIFNKSIKIILDKLNNVQKILEKIEAEDTDIDEGSLRMNTDSINETYTLTLQNETHTLGNLICKHASLIYSKAEMSYVGYKNPHPLKKFIQIDITPQPFTFENAKLYLNTICERIKDIVSTLNL